MQFACNVIISWTGVVRVEITVHLLIRCLEYIHVFLGMLFAFINCKFQESLYDVKFRIEQKAHEKLDSQEVTNYGAWSGVAIIASSRCIETVRGRGLVQRMRQSCPVVTMTRRVKTGKGISPLCRAEKFCCSNFVAGIVVSLFGFRSDVGFTGGQIR